MEEMVIQVRNSVTASQCPDVIACDLLVWVKQLSVCLLCYC